MAVTITKGEGVNIIKEEKIHLEFDGMLLTVYSNEEVERLRGHLKDAGRYQWLRQNARLIHLDGTPEELDQRIDEWMSA
jgi:hypothetical protein